MTPKIASEIQAEQDAGRQKYGGTAENIAHDDAHEEGLWHALIMKHNVMAFDTNGMERRQYLIKVAGLAVSAIEAFDRKIEDAIKRERNTEIIRRIFRGSKGENGR